MGDGMRALKIATIVMAVLIVIGTTTLIITIVRRASAPAPALTSPVPDSPTAAAPWPASLAAVLDEPAGTRIAEMVAVRDRLAIRLQGGGPDRVVLIDLATGAVAGRISLVR
jgi:hypothetical protein